jgi:hypothetical protein
LRHEDREFPREFLATGAGRDVRSAFRALGRAIRTLDEYVHLDDRSLAGADAIVGEQLSEASFVRNYLQLVFDRSRFAVLCPIRIQTPDYAAVSGENGFPDRICEFIAAGVNSGAIDDDDIVLEFGKGRRILLDLPADTPGPEKVVFRSEDGRMTVWN